MSLQPRLAWARLLRPFVFIVCGLLTTSALPAADAPAGITGYVSNAQTGNLLEGARVEIPQLGLTTFTDGTGRFNLEVPAGTHQVVASYTGLDNVKVDVTAAAGQEVTRNFDLTSAVYQLDTFKVTGEREGNAAAITAQRNAANVKNIVAIDAYGNLPNMNASELAVLLPGVAGNLSDEGNIIGFTIRGMPPAMNVITIDGALMGSQGAAGRATRMHTITGSMFDQLELTKGHTPDRESGSLGGTVNLKSRSTLSLKEKRRVTYNLSTRVAPPGTQQIPLREQHRAHPLFNVAYQEVFDAFQGQRNLGVAVNLFYSEQAVGFFSSTRNFQTTTNQPAYLFDYTTEDNYNNRKQSSVNVKVDYRLSPHTKLSLNAIYNDAFERFRLRYDFHAVTGTATTVPSATSGIVPGFTARVTEVRPVAGSNVDITSQMSNFYHRQRHYSFEVEQEFGPLSLDYAYVLSIDHINGGGGDGGVLINRASNIGWILDRTQSDLYPRFIQTAGPDLRNPASYRPNSYNFADTKNIHEPREVRGNARYQLPTKFPLALKTGVRWREEKVEDRSKSRRYNFLGTNSAQLPTDPTVETFGDHKTGLVIPAWNANAIAHGRTPLDPTLWAEDRYFAAQQHYVGGRGVTETTKAGYIMAQGRIGHTGFIAGVRTEKTEDDSFGWVKSRLTVSTAAEQAADPEAAAAKDYANSRREIHGNYTKSFPSVHLTQDITSNLKARLSWSNSFGRPPLNNLYPSETASDTNRTVTVPNPELRPQIAESWDADLSYYFEPVGSLSAGWFHKTIKDYFVNGIELGTIGTGADNGYGGDYGGYTKLGQANLGTAIVQGWEFNYLQQFTFLPGVLKGLAASANYTLLDTHGNFGGAVTRTTGQVAGFVPRSANVSLSWRYRRFSSRVTINRTGSYLRNFTAVGSGANLYTRARTVTNVGLGYQIRPSLSLSLDVNNIFNEPQSWYRGVPDQLAQIYIPGVTVTCGLSGRF
jgi:iron complex outermembrane recepter protein